MAGNSISLVLFGWAIQCCGFHSMIVNCSQLYLYFDIKLLWHIYESVMRCSVYNHVFDPIVNVDFMTESVFENDVLGSAPLAVDDSSHFRYPLFPSILSYGYQYIIDILFDDDVTSCKCCLMIITTHPSQTFFIPIRQIKLPLQIQTKAPIHSSVWSEMPPSLHQLRDAPPPFISRSQIKTDLEYRLSACG